MRELCVRCADLLCPVALSYVRLCKASRLAVRGLCVRGAGLLRVVVPGCARLGTCGSKFSDFGGVGQVGS